MNDPFKILLYEWLNTEEQRHFEALEREFKNVRREPRNRAYLYDYFCEVIRDMEFRNIQAKLYELLK